MAKAHLGAFMHFLPDGPNAMDKIDRFDVRALAAQLSAIGARYFVITLGQNTGYLNSPNAAYDRITGYAPGERCSKRDLPMELYRALKPHGIRLMLYLPAQPPNRDPRAQRAFGLPEGAADQPLNAEVAAKWAEVIGEWSIRYKGMISGWWFDGCYRHVHFDESIASIYAKAVKSGNPHALVAFNPGVELSRYVPSEDYTAGETNEPFPLLPQSRWLDGSQWHVLTFLGHTWMDRSTRYTDDEWAKWVQNVAAKDGAVTIDMGPNYDPASGPISSLSTAQTEQFTAISKALRNRQ